MNKAFRGRIVKSLAAIGASFALVLMAIPGSASSAPAPVASIPLDLQQEEINQPGSSGNALARAKCLYYARGDHSHISTTYSQQNPGKYAVQAHGWWTKGTCPDVIANVVVRVQKKVGPVWVNVGTSGWGDFAPGGGAGNRATATYPCAGIIQKNFFRSQVVALLPGPSATPAYLTTAEKYISCG